MNFSTKNEGGEGGLDYLLFSIDYLTGKESIIELSNGRVRIKRLVD